MHGLNDLWKEVGQLHKRHFSQIDHTIEQTMITAVQN